MYNCQVCLSPSQPNAKVVRIIIYRDNLGHKEIAKELQVCQLCHDGHVAGIPLDRLATMHRLKPKVEAPPAYGPPHPLAGVGLATPPREEAPISKPGKVDFLLANMEEKGNHRKAPPLKAARQHQKVKYENRAKLGKTDRKRIAEDLKKA